MSKKNETYNEKDKEKDVRSSNILAAKGVAELIRTSLGPKGMDKMITDANGETSISNDGATILKQLQVTHPTARMLVELSKAQDIEAGDGTTSVVVIAGALLSACQSLIDQGIHPTQISESFQNARDKATQILEQMATKIDITDREQLIKAAVTSLSSKIVSQNANLLAPIAADSILKIINPTSDINVDLNDVKIVKKLGGTTDDSEIVDGLVFNNRVSHTAGGPTRIDNAKIGLIQFQLSPPKTDMENNVVVTDYTMMDRILREERAYLLNICKKIKASGCNVLLIQKSILRDAVTDVSLHFLAKMKIMVIKDVERTDVEFIAKTLNLLPIASIDSFTAEKLGSAALVHEEDASGEKIVKVTGIQNKGKTITILLRGSNRLMIDETERSLHDALCVMRSLVKKRYLIAGGGAPEVELSLRLGEYAKTLVGAESYCFRAFAEALEVIPTTLAENAGLHPISIVTELRNRHAQGEKYSGINVRKGLITNILEENVIQPLLVSTSAITLATETVRMILKIDDIVIVR